MSETCVICDKRADDGISISRCCCDSDWICRECLATKTLAQYVDKAVSVL